MSITKRTVCNHVETLTHHGGARTVRWETPPHGLSVLEIEHIDPAYGRGRKDEDNHIRPPYHWHWYQTEFFHIKQGAFIFTLEGKSFRHTAADPQPVTIPVTHRHTFKTDPDCTETCIIEISAQPPDSGLSERFFRNIYGYLDDCETQKVTPSPIQLLMFLDSAEVSLALPGPRFVANPISWLIGVVLGRWLGWLLGYRDDYPEYYDAKRVWKK